MQVKYYSYSIFSTSITFILYRNIIYFLRVFFYRALYLCTHKHKTFIIKQADYPREEFPYENLLARKNKYRHCQNDNECGKTGNTLKCKNMACLGKICVDEPISGCVSGFDCPPNSNCVNPRCVSQLENGFGICIPLDLDSNFEPWNDHQTWNGKPEALAYQNQQHSPY